MVFDGRVAEAERNLDRETEIDWIAGYGPQGGLVVRLILDEDTRERVRMVTYYVDGVEKSDPPEEHPGGYMAGYDITGHDGSLKGIVGAGGEVDHDEVIRGTIFYVHAYAKPDLRPDNAHTILDVLDNPLEVETGDLDVLTSNLE